jgi:hypothetical protein
MIYKMPEITKEQFEKYLQVQLRGNHNMLSNEAAEETGLPIDIYKRILKEYTQLMNKYKDLYNSYDR